MNFIHTLPGSKTAVILIMAGLAALVPAPVWSQTGPPPALLEDLVAANRILFDQGVVDGFGHVSIRNPSNSHSFFMARGMSPGLVTAMDIGEFDLDGNTLVTLAGRPNSERYIHSEIYRARHDVNAIVHSHSPGTIPFGVTGTPLRPIFHDASFLYTGAPVFEIRSVAGDASNLLVRNGNLGKALAKALGDNAVVLMRGHGNAVVASTLRVVVFRAVFTEINARLLMQALSLGGPIVYLSPGEGAALETYVNEVGIDRVWDLWRGKVAATNGAAR